VDPTVPAADPLQGTAPADPTQRRVQIEQLVEQHLALADALARRYTCGRRDDDDLRQVARLGLIEAAQRYDPAQGEFTSFAVPTIGGVLKRHLRDQAWAVRPPRSLQEQSLRIRDCWPDLAQQLGPEPTIADLSRALGESTASVAAGRQAIAGFFPASLPDDPADTDDPQRNLERVEARLIIRSILNELSDDERRLIQLRFFLRMSQEEIAMRTGTNQMRVSRQLSRLLTKLRILIGSLDDSPC
jgi:RNA polymerase sigma-B factor